MIEPIQADWLSHKGFAKKEHIAVPAYVSVMAHMPHKYMLW